MQTVYEASSAIEAHMILDLLKQEGLSAQILGEYLPGAMGELPCAGLVRVVVDEQDFVQARAVIERWDAVQPRETAPLPVVREANALLGFLLGLLIGIGGAYAYYRSPVTVDGIDYNRDGVLDEKWTFAPRGTLLKSEVDRNLDGKVDYIIHHDSAGLIETAEADDNFDGIFETRNRFRSGNLELSEADTDDDRYHDLRWHYTSGILTSAEYMNSSTFLPLRVEFYRLGKLTTAQVDSDKDGQLDTRYTYNSLGEVSAVEKMQK